MRGLTCQRSRKEYFVGFVEDCAKFLQDLFSAWPMEVPAYQKGENYSQVCFVPMAFSPKSGLSISCVSNAVFRSLEQCFIP